MDDNPQTLTMSDGSVFDAAGVERVARNVLQLKEERAVVREQLASALGLDTAPPLPVLVGLVVAALAEWHEQGGDPARLAPAFVAEMPHD